MVEFAQELIDAIIDEVAATDEWYDSPDRKSLNACALAARTFLVPSQRRLFQSLTLPVKRGDMKEVALQFTTSPHLGSYVHDLHLENVSYNAVETDIASGTIFTTLSSVRRLVISERKRWDPASREFYTGLISMLGRPSLRSIGFFQCRGVPISLFSRAMSAGYEEVALATTDFDHNNTDSEIERSPGRGGHSTSALLRLALAFWPERTGVVGDLMMSDHIAGSLEHVQHLSLSIRTPGAFAGLRRIALKCVKSLQHLEMDFDTSDVGPVDLPLLPGLRFLTLQARGTKLRVPDLLMTVMATLPDRTPNVEIVNVVVILHGRSEKYEDDPHLPLTDSALKRLPRLHDVHIYIYTAGGDLHFRNATTKRLPMANDAGLLSFSIHKDPITRYLHPMRYFSNN
ncbi:hypothetical protein DFH06DRAFT_1481663 [Mycena polygramma]|nr:hypothetical protein DFH06DRAFT_1481663 [Mycena polygramma]